MLRRRAAFHARSWLANLRPGCPENHRARAHLQNRGASLRVPLRQSASAEHRLFETAGLAEFQATFADECWSWLSSPPMIVHKLGSMAESAIVLSNRKLALRFPPKSCS